MLRALQRVANPVRGPLPPGIAWKCSASGAAQRAEPRIRNAREDGYEDAHAHGYEDEDGYNRTRTRLCNHAKRFDKM